MPARQPAGWYRCRRGKRVLLSNQLCGRVTNPPPPLPPLGFEGASEWGDTYIPFGSCRRASGRTSRREKTCGWASEKSCPGRTSHKCDSIYSRLTLNTHTNPPPPLVAKPGGGNRETLKSGIFFFLSSRMMSSYKVVVDLFWN